MCDSKSKPKYKVGDKIKLVKLDSTIKRFGYANGSMEREGIIVELTEEKLYLERNRVDIGDYCYSLDDFELVKGVKNYRELTSDTLVDVSIDGNEFKAPLGDLIHAKALIGVANGLYGYKLFNALKDVFDKDEVISNNHDYDDVNITTAQDLLIKSYFIDKEKEAKKQALKDIIEKQREEISKLEQQLIALDAYDGCSL